MKKLIVIVQVYDLNGNPVTVQYTNPSVGALEMCIEHTQRVCGKPIEIIEWRVIQC
jgi:hypothetical protein